MIKQSRLIWFDIQSFNFQLLLYVLPCAILFLCFSVLLALRLPRLGKRELILVLFVRLIELCLFDLSVSSSSWCLGRAAVCDCGTLWTFLLPFFSSYSLLKKKSRRQMSSEIWHRLDLCCLYNGPSHLDLCCLYNEPSHLYLCCL